MDIERRRQLKRQGKAEVERRSAESKAQSEALISDMIAALSHTGVLPLDPTHLDPDARTRYEREQWVMALRPTIHKEQLHAEFIPLPDPAGKWKQHPLGYVMCKRCHSVLPAIPPERLFYTSSCACGNLQWRRWLWRGKFSMRDSSKALPIGIFARANNSFKPSPLRGPGPTGTASCGPA